MYDKTRELDAEILSVIDLSLSVESLINSLDECIECVPTTSNIDLFCSGLFLSDLCKSQELWELAIDYPQIEEKIDILVTLIVDELKKRKAEKDV